MDQLVYLDHAATTRVKEEVYEAMQPYFQEYYGNPSSIYRFAGIGKKAIEEARETIAGFINAKSEEIYFTGGGSESDNWAIKGAAFAKREYGKRREYESNLRDYLIDRVLAEIPYTRLNGHRTKRLSNNANFSFRFIEGESLLILLDQNGIAASSGSACTSGSLDPSHVLLAIGLLHEIAHGSLRFTLSDETTKEELDYTIEKLKQIVERLRNMSPLYEDFVRNNTAK